MPLITDKDAPAMCRDLNRRAFLRLISVTGAGTFACLSIGALPISFTIQEDVCNLSSSFYKKFTLLALDLGMTQVGSSSRWFKRNPKIRDKIRFKLNKLLEPKHYSCVDDLILVSGYGVTVFPVYNRIDPKLVELAFFELDTGNLIHVLPWYGALALPEVNTLLVKEGANQETRAAYLIPRRPPSKLYSLSERYSTSAGSAEFVYEGSNTDGEVKFTLWKRRRHGTLEELVVSGTLGVSSDP